MITHPLTQQPRLLRLDGIIVFLFHPVFVWSPKGVIKIIAMEVTTRGVPRWVHMGPVRMTHLQQGQLRCNG